MSDEIRDLFESDRWSELRFEGERLHIGEDLARAYREREFAPMWSGDGARLHKLLALLDSAETHGLRRSDYHRDWLAARAFAPADAAAMAEVDLVASDAFLLLALHLARGKVAEERIAGWHVTRPSPDLAAHLLRASAGEPAAALDALLPRHPAYHRLREALGRYREMARQGGWPAVPAGPALRPGDRGPRVAALRRRLAIAGDLSSPGAVDSFDADVAAAVRRFQERHGLDPDEVVGPRTRAELNVPVEVRIRQLEVNLERWRWLEPSLGDRYVLVNIAGFRAGLYDHDRLTLGMRAIVGKLFQRSPIFSDSIRYLVLNPYWNIPSSIAREVRRKGWRYMQRNGIEARRGGRLRQRPGPRNPLGRVKFMFPNRFNVYLHDTPARELFERPSRPFSHGCIRLEQPLELAALLLAGQGWTNATIRSAASGSAPVTVSLDNPVPVHILYWTAWIAEDDTLHFRRDLYGRDRAVERALRHPEPHPLPSVTRR